MTKVKNASLLVNPEISGKFRHEMGGNMLAYFLENGIVMLSGLHELLLMLVTLV